MQETGVRFLSQENPLEKEMAIHSSILAWKIPWIEEPGGLQSMGLPRVGHDLETKQQQQQYICQLTLGKFKVLFVKSDVLWPGKLLAKLPLASYS